MRYKLTYNKHGQIIVDKGNNSKYPDIVWRSDKDGFLYDTEEEAIANKHFYAFGVDKYSGRLVQLSGYNLKESLLKEEDNKSYVTYAEEHGVSSEKAKEYWEKASKEVKDETGKTKDELGSGDWSHIMGIFKKIIDNSKKQESITTTKKYIIEDTIINKNVKVLIEKKYKYEITKHFLPGSALEGLDYVEQTDVEFKVGQKVLHPYDKAPYEVTKVKLLEAKEYSPEWYKQFFEPLQLFRLLTNYIKYQIPHDAWAEDSYFEDRNIKKVIEILDDKFIHDKANNHGNISNDIDINEYFHNWFISNSKDKVVAEFYSHLNALGYDDKYSKEWYDRYALK